MSAYFDQHPELEVIWTAHNGKVCLSMLQENKPDLFFWILLCHIWMGLLFWIQLKKILALSDMHIIMLTAFGQEDVMAQAGGLGASYFMLKPFEFDRLVSSNFPNFRNAKTCEANRSKAC